MRENGGNGEIKNKENVPQGDGYEYPSCWMKTPEHSLLQIIERERERERGETVMGVVKGEKGERK